MNTQFSNSNEALNIDFHSNARWFHTATKNDFAVARFKLNTKTPRIHFSNSFCFSVVTAGHMQCKQNGVLRNLSAGEVSLFQPKSLVADVELDKTARLDCLYINPQFLSESIVALQSLSFDKFISQSSVLLSGPLFDSWKQVIEVGLSSASREIVYDYLTDFIDQAVEAVEKNKSKSVAITENDLYNKTLSCLIQNENASLESMSLELKKSADDLSKEFLKSVGIEINEFINAYKVEVFKEKSILSIKPLDTNDSVKQAFERAWQVSSDDFKNVIYLKTS